MLFLILIVKYIFRFRFRPKMAGLFRFRLFFGRKRKFIFGLFLFYGRKSKVHFRSASNTVVYYLHIVVCLRVLLSYFNVTLVRLSVASKGNLPTYLLTSVKTIPFLHVCLHRPGDFVRGDYVLDFIIIWIQYSTG